MAEPMSEPKRYTGKCEAQALGSPHWEHPEGEWVKWEDYARLKAEVERLREAGDEMEKHVGREWAPSWVVEDWQAAKEGKQS